MPDQISDTLIITLFKRILNEEVLSDIDLKEASKHLVFMAMDYHVPRKEFKNRVQKFRKAIPNFLEKFEETLLEVEAHCDRFHKMMEEDRKFIASLPEGVNALDAPEVIEFARSLKKEYYSFSQAARFLGITRQTLKKYAENGQYGFKLHPPVGKLDKVHKEEIINYFRNENFPDYDPFAKYAT